MEQIRRVGYCPSCGNKSPQRLIHVQHCSDTAYAYEDEEAVDLPLAYYVAACETCDGILLYQSISNILEDGHFNQAELVYPHSGELHKSVPSRVAKIYKEAARIKNLAPNAFAVQIRRALEALCEDRGAQKAVLQKQLKELADKGEIPTKLAELSDVLRLVGNIGAHAAEEEVKAWQVYAIDEFFRAVVEYVYVAPGKLEEYRESLELFEKGKSKKADTSV
jgi:Domain of unknown function (DUF4145)